jgi:hypothetical protein
MFCTDLVPASHNAGCPALLFLKGGIPRSSPAWDLSRTPVAPSFIQCTDDPRHPPTLFAKCAKKDGEPAEVEWPHATKGKGAPESECALVKVRS